MRLWTRTTYKSLSFPDIPHRRRHFSALAQPAIREREGHTPLEDKRIDPYTILAPELAQLHQTLLHLLGSSHPHLTQVAEYYFLHPSKQLRPLLVLLFARAVNGLTTSWPRKNWEANAARGRAEELDRPLSRPDVLNDWNPNMPDNTASFQTTFSLRSPLSPPHKHMPQSISTVPGIPPSLSNSILPTQIRLAQIVEMIHVASLLHDDVLDLASLRRGAPSAPAQFGNKLSILAGDFMLGRASAALSRLGSSEVVELIAGVISNLVEGEIMQLKETNGITSKSQDITSLAHDQNPANHDRWSVYLQKTYLKTASLMAKGARASVVLGGASDNEIWKEVAYAYGRNIGIAFQLVDDVLDYEAGDSVLGKPGGADLRLGLTTGPALYAWEEHAAMGPLIKRKFDSPGDVEMARDFVRRSSGVQRTRALAQQYVDKAVEVISVLPGSDAKLALIALAEMVISRKR